MSNNRTRQNRIVFYVTDEELELITKKMDTAGIRNREAYIRKMILDGYILRLDLPEMREMIRLLSNVSNNVNQIAKRSNETRNVYESDIKDVQDGYNRLWDQAEKMLKSLAKLIK